PACPWCWPSGGAGPPPERYAWVEPPGPRPVVVHAARHCYDHAYAGAGNWAFNTAYAGLHGVEAFVTRLRSLAEAEAFVAAGVPLVVSAAFRAGQVPGLDYDTRGHLMVLVGFTEAGDPVLNDPYAPDDASVRRIVDRARFEAAWQDGSGGATYVIHPASVPLPAPPAQPNW
ncbi:C39 family peptidase, partial [Micromonospora sp. 4G55]|uniref:C39 family peptidase n=1 Tax=Micromonospora sp. 4G55 TaxID=2806102 RepID=UPI001EE4910B